MKPFIRCEIFDEYTVDYAASILAHLPGVTRLFVDSRRSEVVIEVAAKGKAEFDDAVMSSIQAQWSVVKSTRTLLTINDLSWRRAPSPVSGGGGIFVSLASQDLPLGTALARRVEADSGLKCWVYSELAPGSTWPAEVDHAIRQADLHLFLLSTASLASAECQREFTKVDAIADARDVCCILVPGCDLSSLPPTYQERQCLKAEDLFAYPRLLEWISARLLG